MCVHACAFLACWCLTRPPSPQANFTGPEVTEASVAHVYPLPCTRAALAAEEAGAAAAVAAGAAAAAEAAAAAPAAAADPEFGEALARLTAPVPAASASAARALSGGGDGDIADALLYPQLLLAARALGAALSPVPVAPGAPSVGAGGGAAAVATAASGGPARGAAAAPPRPRALAAGAARLRTAPWWHARSVVAQARGACERSPAPSLAAAAHGLMRAAGAALPLPPPLLGLFVPGDASMTATRDGPSVAAAAAAAGAGALGPRPIARALAARLLLEWGLAQHVFGRTGAAKASFQAAKVRRPAGWSRPAGCILCHSAPSDARTARTRLAAGGVRVARTSFFVFVG